MSLKKRISTEQKTAVQSSSKPQSQASVSIVTPKCVHDVECAIDCLRHEQQVIVDLACLSAESAERALNVFGGAVYALGGAMKRLKDRLYLLTSDGVNIVVS